MLALLLKIGDNIFAIAARSVVEVVPKVQLRPAPESGPYVAGLLVHRGAILPTVDLCARVEGRPSRSLLSSRIVVVQYARLQSTKTYGILSENVTDVRDLAGAELVHVDTDMAAFIRGTIWSEGQMIHLLDVETILPERAPKALVSAGVG